MKKSELREIIKEEYDNILNEEIMLSSLLSYGIVGLLSFVLGVKTSDLVKKLLKDKSSFLHWIKLTREDRKISNAVSKIISQPDVKKMIKEKGWTKLPWFDLFNSKLSSSEKSELYKLLIRPDGNDGLMFDPHKFKFLDKTK